MKNTEKKEYWGKVSSNKEFQDKLWREQNMPTKLKHIAVVCLLAGIAVVSLSAGRLLEGSGREVPYIKEFTPETYMILKETGQGMGQSAGEDTKESVEGIHTEKSAETDIKPPRSPYVDFSYIEENHEILEYDICAEPQYDWENTPLEEYVREDMEFDAEMCRKVYVAVPLTIDFFTFDFNDDGLEDYLVCEDGVLWSGSGGNSVNIYVQENNGSLRNVLSITARLHDNPDGSHARFTVLNEKTDGYYAIVLPSNRILRYDENTGKYEFHDGE